MLNLIRQQKVQKEFKNFSNEKFVSLVGKLVTPSESKACLMGISHFDLATDNKSDTYKDSYT